MHDLIERATAGVAAPASSRPGLLWILAQYATGKPAAAVVSLWREEFPDADPINADTVYNARQTHPDLYALLRRRLFEYEIADNQAEIVADSQRWILAHPANAEGEGGEDGPSVARERASRILAMDLATLRLARELEPPDAAAGNRPIEDISAQVRSWNRALDQRAEAAKSARDPLQVVVSGDHNSAPDSASGATD